MFVGNNYKIGAPFDAPIIIHMYKRLLNWQGKGECRALRLFGNEIERTLVCANKLSAKRKSETCAFFLVFAECGDANLVA